VSLIAGLVLGIMALYLIGYPILTDEDIDVIDYEDRVTTLEEDSELKKETIFAELSELELDYQMDKFSKNKYEKLKERLQELAIEVLEDS
jgi:hypothetical protein